MSSEHSITFLFPPKYNMTKTSTTRPRVSSKKHHYRPQRVNLHDLRPKPKTVPPRVVYVQNPDYDQMECGSKKVEARPNYPCLQDLVPGTLVKFSNRFSGRSFLATITGRRVHRDFTTMLRVETIKDCLPDRDPHDLQRAVNVYHSFRDNTYRFIAKKHKVVALRFEHVEPVTPVTSERTPIRYDRSEYKRNSLCAIFEYVEKKRRERLWYKVITQIAILFSLLNISLNISSKCLDKYLDKLGNALIRVFAVLPYVQL